MNPPTILINPHFLASPRQLFAFLMRSVTWDERMRARKTASFGVSYDYSQISYAPVAMPAELDAICHRLEVEIGFLPNNCLLNHYQDGTSSMGFHSDSSQGLAEGTGVAIVSLGSARPIVFRSKADRTQEFGYTLPSGSMLYMEKEIQDHWLHAIPRVAEAGERISLTFRCIVQ
jgi:alkylated DNA repair dioxygenase AlkB